MKSAAPSISGTIIARMVVLLLLAGLLTGCQKAGEGSSKNSSAQNSIQNVGSDTMVNLALAWAETYQKQHAEVSLSITGGGSGTGIAALINGTIDIANASRQIKAEEIAAAKKIGIEPVEFVVAKDAIAVVVHLENPVERLTLQQIADIYSGKINNWLEVGGDDRPIVRLSRETNSGTHVYFLENVLRMGDKENKTLFATNTLLMPSSEGIIVEVRQNPNAIGYDGLGYVTEDMKVLAVAPDEQSPYIIPSVETVNNGSYPIARDLYMYTAGQPAGAVLEYMDFIFSTEAQEIVASLGFVPIQR